MKRFVGLFTVVIALCLAFSFSAFAKKDAEEKTKAMENSKAKFGYVDMNRALNDVEEGKKAKKQLEAQISEKKQKLTAYEQELKQMKDDLEKKRLVLSQDALKEKEEEFRKKFVDLQQNMGKYQQEVANLEMQLTQGILLALRDIVKEIGANEGYTMILETSRDVVLYAPADSDLTDKVISIYNSRKGKK